MFFNDQILKKLSWRLKKQILLLFYILSGCYGLANNRDTLPPDSVADVVKITRSWVLPATLRDISAIEITSAGRIACLQNETGSIFIFNLETGLIDKEISFGPPGNYEGLVMVNGTAYVGCADGRILEVANYASDSPAVTEYGTHLTVDDHLNGLCYDKKNKRLLVSVRGNENINLQYKSIYAFNLAQKTMPVKPVIRIDLKNRIFNGIEHKNLQTVFQPSDLDIDRRTGQLYIIDGTRRQLLRMRLSESIRDLTELNREKFFQPEGIRFTPSGELFIASKGDRDEPGMLLQVRVR